MFSTAASKRRRPPHSRLTVELLEARDLLDGQALGPLVQVSGPSPFAGSTADYNQPGPLLLNREAENYAAVNPTNLNNIVDVWRQDQWPSTTGAGPRGLAAGVTFDGGNTWKEVVIPGLTLVSGGRFQYASDPWISFGPDGTAYVVSVIWNSSGPGLAGDIDVNISKDGGLNWSAPITVRHDSSDIDFNDKESVTADPTQPGLVYAGWDHVYLPPGVFLRSATAPPDGFRQPALFSRSTDGGHTWEPAQTLYNPGANNFTFDTQIVVLPSGTLLDFFDEGLNFKNSDGGGKFDMNLSLLRSSDKGRTWLPNGQPIRAAKIVPLAVTDPNTGQVLAQNSGTGSFNVAVDLNSGNLYAVWQDGRLSGGEYNSIAFSMSSDGGLTWSTPIKINQTPGAIPAPDQQAFQPSIAVSRDGTVAVTYYDFRNNISAPASLTDYWMVFAHPGTDMTNPASWAGELRLTDTSFDLQKADLSSVDGNAPFLGDYQSLVAAGNGFGAFFSMTTANGGPHLFFRDPPGAGSTAAQVLTAFFAALAKGEQPHAEVDDKLVSPSSYEEGVPVAAASTQAASPPKANITAYFEHLARFRKGADSSDLFSPLA